MLLAFERAEREADPARRSALLTFVIVGGGPTGVELAGALAEIARQSLAQDFRHFDPRSARIILHRGRARRSCRRFPSRCARRRGAIWSASASRCAPDTLVTRVGPGGVETADESIDAATVLWAAGVAASPLGATLGVPLDRAGRVLVQPDLTIPGHPEVFVIGDLASLPAPNGKPLPGVAQVAIQMGEHAAHNIHARDRGAAAAPVPVPATSANMATIGRASAVADFGWLQLKRLDRLAGLAVRPHPQPDRLSQPHRRAWSSGRGRTSATSARSA